mmetsp:Transcript_4870/g.5989  ORF Transcript_4870/g.5989 Transcript_4870/m.5989 type:complete len:149 (-) Transcript_4870:121-567(-)
MVRIKTRWFLARYESKHSSTWRDISVALSKAVRSSKFVADAINVAKVLNCTKVVVADTESHLFLVRVEQQYAGIIKYALERMKTIRRQKVSVSILHVSATMQQCRLALDRMSRRGLKIEPSASFKNRVKSLNRYRPITEKTRMVIPSI